MVWLYLTFTYLVLAAALSFVTRSAQKGARLAGFVFFGGGLLFSLLNPTGFNFRLALVFTAGLALMGGWALFRSLITYDDALQTRWDEAREEKVASQENAPELEDDAPA